jgi:hypothetical protein
MIKLKDILNETASREAMGIAKFTGTRAIAVQKFIDDFNLNAKKLFNFIAKGKLKDRMDFATAISGTSGNKYQGNFVGMFGESTINEDSETKRLEMLIKNLEETIKLLVQQLKDNKSLPNNKKENIKKSIAVNLDLINYYKKWLKDYQAAANESVNEAKAPYEVYHKSYTSAIEAAREYAEKKGYEINNDDAFTKIGMGPRKPSEGKTNKFSIELSKDGKVQRKKLQIQVYGMRNSYELNAYIQ